MEVIQVESGVGLPPVRVVYRYPYLQMKVGDSFTVPKSARAKVLNANVRARKKYGMAFTSKADGDLVRVWRIS